MILVSHDRYLLEACADRLWLVQGGKVTPFDGDLDDYRRQVLSGESQGITVGAKSPARRPGAGAPRRRRQARRDRAAAQADFAGRGRDRATDAPARKSSTRRLPTATCLPRDPARAAELSKTRANVVAALAKAEEEWLAASAALETA